MTGQPELPGPSGAHPDTTPVQPLAVASEPVDDPAIAAVFGEHAALARGYHRHLATTGVSHGLIGPREIPRLWTRHLFNCAALCPLLPEGASVIDVGSGAGLPGLVLAIARPDLTVTLIEPLERRVTWLQTVIADLGLPTTAVRCRAEELRRLQPDLTGADIVTARAVAPLAKLVVWTVPLCAAEGAVLAMKGRNAPGEVAAAAGVLRRSRVHAEIVNVGTAPIEATTVVRLTRTAR